jgi:hypothetical protein
MNTEIFDMNKMYRFNKELTNGGKWTELCDGLIVEVESENLGKIKVNSEEYIVFPRQCNLVEVDPTSRKEGNVYKEKLIIEDIIKKIDNCFTNSIKEDPYFTKYIKGYTYVFDIMNVPNEDLEGWMFKIDENKALTRVNENKAIVEDCDGIVHEIPRRFATAIETFENGKNYELAWDLIPIQKRLLKKYKPLELCDGMIVDPVNQFEATIKYEGEEYIIDREWCLEVDEMEF